MIQIRKTIEIVKKTRSLFMNTDAARRYHRKGAADYVTEIDTAVQDFLNQELYAQYPQVQFMGEEKDNTSIDFSKPLWMILYTGDNESDSWISTLCGFSCVL